MRKLTYYIGSSLDGFIADVGGGLGRFQVGPELIDFVATEYPETLPGQAREQLGLGAPGRHFDTIVQGRGSYSLALDAGITNPYPHLRQYVVSSTLGERPNPAVTVIPSDPVAAVRALKEEDGGGIYLAGGGNLAGQLIEEIDELVVKVYPLVLGDGIPMFGGQAVPKQLKLTNHQVLADGVAVMSYK